jgi:hypothetical protein
MITGSESSAGGCTKRRLARDEGGTMNSSLHALHGPGFPTFASGTDKRVPQNGQGILIIGEPGNVTD